MKKIYQKSNSLGFFQHFIIKNITSKLGHKLIEGDKALAADAL